MAKLVASLAALVLFGSLGAAAAGGSVEHGPAHASDPLDSVMIGQTCLNNEVNGIEATSAQTRASRAQGIATKATSNSSVVVPKGKMSPEERARREAACVKDWESDMDWCRSTTDNIRNKEKRDEAFRICRDRARMRLADCMARLD